jgi:hypothetical protein
VSWSGEGPYRDRFCQPPADLVARLRASLETLGIDVIRTPAGVRTPAASRHDSVDQIPIERYLLAPLRQAVARGELVVTPAGLLEPCPPDRFRGRHEAEVFAEMLAADDEVLAPAAVLARLVAPLERSLRFRTTGSVNAYEVQRARLPLRGESLGLYVLRDAGGIIRLAVFSHGESIFNRRDDPVLIQAKLNATELAVLLPSSYLTPWAESPPAWEPGESARIREVFQRTSPLESSTPLPGERIVAGLRASPGRAVGSVLFSTAGRTPADFDGAVLVAASVRPEDSMFLYHAAGIVSTGGGI